jgi:hypothetical protein
MWTSFHASKIVVHVAPHAAECIYKLESGGCGPCVVARRFVARGPVRHLTFQRRGDMKDSNRGKAVKSKKKDGDAP